MRRVALLIETSRTYGRDLLRGVKRYTQEHGPWSLFVEVRDLETRPPVWLRNWDGDGILTRSGSAAIARAVKRAGVPAVELRSTRRAGKDVYCEKPLTLTVDEGKLLTRVVKETGRVVQVGSWQRSDDRFRQAVEMVRGGRIGRLQKVEVVLGKNATSGSFVPRTPPAHLNWNLWQGQTPDVPYIEERSHYTFRWWYEYSGGQMTDWGAHHIDIAQWAIDSNPVEIHGTARMPNVVNGYNVAIDFNVTYKYANGVMMTVSDTGDNGILFTGDAGRMFVNRGKITGAPVEALKTNPLNREDWKVYDYDNLERPPRAGKLDAIINHMGNFFDCVETRRTPVSDVESQHRSVSTCHLGNISMRLGRPLKWDPERELFRDDAEANAMLGREQRKGFEVI